MRWKNNKQNLILAFFVIVAIFGGGLFVYKTKTNVVVAPQIHEAVRFGGIVPLTGTRSAYGVPLQRAAQLAVDEINKKGGLFGEQIQIFWEDGKCLPAAAKAAAEKLVTKAKVQFIFGGVCSNETLAAAPITEAGKVVLISPASTAAEITSSGQYVFRLTQSDTLVGSVAANYAFTNLGYKKVAIVRENTSYITGIATSFINSFKGLHGEVVYDQKYNTGARGSAAFITEALKANPDVIYLLPDSPTQGLQQLEKLKTAKNTIPIIVDEVLLDGALVTADPEIFEGVIGVQSYFDNGTERAQKFLASYKQQYAEDPKFPYFMANMYDAVYLAKNAIEKNGSDPDKIKSWLLAQKRWPGVAGDVTFDANGDYLAKFSIVKINAGKVEFQEVYDTSKK
ncbi:MAG: ABC transporter substrate-binding protein [bacterium]